MKTKTSIEMIGGIIAIIGGVIAIYQFRLSERPPEGPKPPVYSLVKQARLLDIANVIKDVTGNQVVLLTSNYDTPIRSLYSASDTANRGVNSERTKERGLPVIDEAGSALLNSELQARLEKKFGNSPPIDLDSSVSSIYIYLFPN